MLRKKEQKIILNTDLHSSEKIELVHSGKDFFNRLLRIISEAKSEIHLQTYIFENDATGTEIAHALKEAASRNVKVYILLDGYGSSSLPKHFINDLMLKGINIRFFSPFFSMNSIYLGRRLHHKIVVADGNIVLLGGINIADKYRGSTTKEPWLDYAVQIKSVTIATYLEQLCKMIYFQKNRESIEKTKTVFQLPRGLSVCIIQNDWLKRKDEIYNAYIKAIQNAKREVIVVGSYFLPGRRLLKALKQASLDGVKIKLILSGISDVPAARRATCYLYTSLLKHNIELYEWKRSVLHAKVAMVDNEWSTIGSFNLNHLSFYGSIELNVEISSQEFSRTLAIHLNHIITQCENITYETIKARRGLLTTLLNWFIYQLVRILLRIATYIPYKRFFERYQDE